MRAWDYHWRMPPKKAPTSERRKGPDRRKVDKDPPNGRERRVSLEPRKPEVEELDVSLSDWVRLEDDLKR